MREQIDNLRKEAETTLRVFYAFKQFRFFLTNQSDVDKLNENPYFWPIYESSLRTNLFLGIRRLYENKGNTFNFQSFITQCIKKVDTFSKNSLRLRKTESSPNASQWIDTYMNNAYEPSVEDFKRLAKEARNNSKKMKGIYTKAASEIYAHAVHTDYSTMAKITEQLSFDEIEIALSSIWHVYEQVWQMYENGRKPIFEIGTYPYKQEIIDSVVKQLK